MIKSFLRTILHSKSNVVLFSLFLQSGTENEMTGELTRLVHVRREP